MKDNLMSSSTSLIFSFPTTRQQTLGRLVASVKMLRPTGRPTKISFRTHFRSWSRLRLMVGRLQAMTSTGSTTLCGSSSSTGPASAAAAAAATAPPSSVNTNPKSDQPRAAATIAAFGFECRNSSCQTSRSSAPRKQKFEHRRVLSSRAESSPSDRHVVSEATGGQVDHPCARELHRSDLGVITTAKIR